MLSPPMPLSSYELNCVVRTCVIYPRQLFVVSKVVALCSRVDEVRGKLRLWSLLGFSATQKQVDTRCPICLA